MNQLTDADTAEFRALVATQTGKAITRHEDARYTINQSAFYGVTTDWDRHN
jgi:hypothetical protein